MTKFKTKRVNVHLQLSKFFLKELDKHVKSGEGPPGVSNRTAMINWLVTTYLLNLPGVKK